MHSHCSVIRSAHATKEGPVPCGSGAIDVGVLLCGVRTLTNRQQRRAGCKAECEAGEEGGCDTTYEVASHGDLLWDVEERCVGNNARLAQPMRVTKQIM